jgi:hypothetical protein
VAHPDKAIPDKNSIAMSNHVVTDLLPFILLPPLFHAFS